jgi:hypothetical protein
MTGQSQWISRIYRSIIPVTAPLSSSALCAQSLRVYTQFQHKPTQGWLPETHTYLTLTYKLTLNTRHAAHKITKCWMTIHKSQTVYCTSLPDSNLSLLNAVFRSLKNMGTAWQVIWTGLCSFQISTKTLHQTHSPTLHSFQLFPLYMPVFTY